MRNLRDAAIVFLWLGWVASRLPAEPAVAAKEWPFYQPVQTALPASEKAVWARSAIDRYVLARLEAEGLQPAPEASRRTLIRRVYFDLIGLPPSPGDVEAFVRDETPGAYERLVDRLLADPRYGERWARHWLDLARYADTAGYEGDPDTPWAWRYRDYVIDSFNRDKAYDMFVKEQIAGDEFQEIMGAGQLPLPEAEKVVAMTFLRLAPFTEPRGDETRHELLSEMTSTVGSVFLGMTVGCAKCHDHKYDKIPTRDFYRMKAFFATVQLAPPERGDIFQIGGPQPAEFYIPGEKEWADGLRSRHESEHQAVGEELDTVASRLKAAVEKAGTKESLDRVIQNGSVELDPDDVQRYKALGARRRLVQQRIKRLQPLAMSLRHSFGPPYEPGVPTSRVLVRGEYDNPGEVVEPGFLSAITGDQEATPIRLDPFKRWPTRSRRMALAKWIASPENPMTARVMVNRLWHWHFGLGIVSTPSDFGVLGGGPSHPELLDALALRLVESGWSLKAMHRLMVTSSTYRQASLHQNARAMDVDPGNSLLWRFRRQRLPAEAIRDSILTVSGRLTPRIFGLPIFPPLPGGIEETVKYSRSKWDTQHGAEARRRSIYVYQQRTLNMPLLDVFDAVICEEPRDLRRASVTALQALELYNGEFVNEESRHFAERVRRETVGGGREAWVETAFLMALGRRPKAGEAQPLMGLLTANGAEDDGLVGLCRVLLNSNEFVYID